MFGTRRTNPRCQDEWRSGTPRAAGRTLVRASSMVVACCRTSWHPKAPAKPRQ